jgi:hypothetical protein
VKEALKGFFKRLKIEVSWFLVRFVLLSLNFGLEFRYLTASRLLLSLSFLTLLATGLSVLFLVFPIQVVACSVDVALRQTKDFKGMK